MDADIAPVSLAFCRTGQIRAEYRFEVHWASPFDCADLKCAHEPRFVQIYPLTTLYCGATSRRKFLEVLLQ
jgi:hypothetical protein